MQVANLLERGMIAAEVAPRVSLAHQVVSEWPKAWRQGEQGLLRTFGRIIPAAMTLCVVMSVAYAVMGAPVGVHPVRLAAALLFVGALISTLIFNVPVNLATGRWDATAPPPDWQQTRTRWEFFQGVRSWLLLAGFVVLGAAAVR